MVRYEWARIAANVGLLLAAFGFLFWPALRDLVRDWANDGNYSHGFLIAPLAGFFVWQRRERLAAMPLRPRASGIVLVLAGIALLLAGRLGSELFVTRVSMLPVLAGGIVFVLGWRFLAALAFPLAFLLLMIPVPAIVFNQVAFPLQLVASRFGVSVLSALSIPVLREGNVIVLSNTTLEVAEACSGIRSLVSLLAVGIVYGYFIDRRAIVRAVITLSTVPVAIVANGLRVAGTGVAAHYYGLAAAEGLFHAFSGWAMFIPALALLFAIASLVVALTNRAVRPLEPAGGEVN